MVPRTVVTHWFLEFERSCCQLYYHQRPSRRSISICLGLLASIYPDIAYPKAFVKLLRFPRRRCLQQSRNNFVFYSRKGNLRSRKWID